MRSFFACAHVLHLHPVRDLSRIGDLVSFRSLLKFRALRVKAAQRWTDRDLSEGRIFLACTPWCRIALPAHTDGATVVLGELGRKRIGFRVEEGRLSYGRHRGTNGAW